ncbi:efflux RND transporter permease subunit [Geomonas azotofigens]|uniref:efflux RND transporter permease subunit n=1 Tax=Geomonas azotofigens TaxID=2843196 RepID=UPI001C109756|nr:MMPL family transporter [Geomonas azotofigens]MBU5613838.1 MMPL family transporter [Geomonas azotofigens]
MSAAMDKVDQMPVVERIEDFDQRSGNFLERLVFNHRLIVVALSAVITLMLGYQALKLQFNASFEKMLPQSHPYIRNYLENKNELKGLGNSIKAVVENSSGDIYDPQYVDALRQINDELLLTPGVDRAWVKSLWAPAVRWTEVTEEGFVGGPVMPDNYDGSEKTALQLKQHIASAGIVGSIVANNYRSSMIILPLLDTDPDTGQRLSYGKLSANLEKIRAKYQKGNIRIHYIGFAKLVGDLLDGLKQVMTYFLAAAAIAALIIYLYTRCIRSTLLVIACSLIALCWLLGIIATLGYELDPYSILVPFLVFAIGVSHGVQKMNGIMQDVGRGTHKLVAARYTFRRLFLAGLTALLADAVGFAVLMMIDIPVIRDLALTASIGVAILIVTNLLLLPVLLSYTSVSPASARRSIAEEKAQSEGKGVGRLWGLLDRFTERRWAIGVIVFAVAITGAGFVVGLNLQVGDLDPGAPELRSNSRYNKDNKYITENYSLSSDQFAVITKTPAEGGMQYESLLEIDRLGWALQQVPGVQTTVSLPDSVRRVTSGTYEGSPKWLTLNRNQDVLNHGAHESYQNNPDLYNTECSVVPVVAYLSDHKAQTLQRVVGATEDFAARHNTADRKFLLAAGSAGIEAATNIVVKQANQTMMLYVYAAVIILCFITFRDWRAVVVAVLPLVGTSILCEALMVLLGIGVKVATLPVIALGVGIGVDYALYLLSVQLGKQKQGETLKDAYKHAVQFTGKVVGLVGVTLAAGVVTWAFSPIKFQADMGILLTFMFIWNMFGALVLIPALSHFLLGGVAPATETCGSAFLVDATAPALVRENEMAPQAGADGG